MARADHIQLELVHFLNGFEHELTEGFQDHIEIIPESIIILAGLIIKHFLMAEMGTEGITGKQQLVRFQASRVLLEQLEI